MTAPESTISDEMFLLGIVRVQDATPGHAVAIWDLADALGMRQNKVRSKARRVFKRGLITGCLCGCRGDLELTETGRAFLDSLDDAAIHEANIDTFLTAMKSGPLSTPQWRERVVDELLDHECGISHLPASYGDTATGIRVGNAHLIANAPTDITRLLGAVDAVLALHATNTDGQCVHCVVPAPCPTVTAVTAAPAQPASA